MYSINTRIALPDGRHAFVAKATAEGVLSRTWDGDTVSLTATEAADAVSRLQSERAAKLASPLWVQATKDFDPAAVPDPEWPWSIKRSEFEWIKSKVSLTVSLARLQRDLGETDSQDFLAAARSFSERHPGLKGLLGLGEGDGGVFGALAWHGVASRWRDYVAFLDSRAQSAETFPKNGEDGLLQFADSLGRVIGYRALALTEGEYNSIIEADEIVSTGGLRASQLQIDELVVRHGAHRIAVARLFIAHLRKWIGIDPSLSLHDDKETTLTISLTYQTPSKPVYLFEMDVPKIHCLGWHVKHVERLAPLIDPRFRSEPRMRWFEHNDVWFDTWDERTERQLLYSIPFLKARCRSITVFRTPEAVTGVTGEFKARQLAAKDASQCEST